MNCHLAHALPWVHIIKHKKTFVSFQKCFTPKQIFENILYIILGSRAVVSVLVKSLAVWLTGFYNCLPLPVKEVNDLI